MNETQTIVVQVEPAPPSPERVADLLEVFYLFLVALVVVWGAKQLLALFSGDNQL